MNLDRRYIISCCAVVASAFAGCGQDHASGAITADPGTASARPAAQTGAGANGSATSCKTLAVCSDGQALAIAIVANQGEIDEANVVLDRVNDANVRTFAQQMIADHTRLRDALVAVAANPAAVPSGDTSITPITQQPNAISRKLQVESQKAIAELSTLTGQQLDQSYLEREILDHLTTLALMEHVVIPSVTSPSLAMVLGGGTPIVKMHEMAALQI